MSGKRTKRLRKEFTKIHGRPPETIYRSSGAFSEFRRFKRQRRNAIR